MGAPFATAVLAFAFPCLSLPIFSSLCLELAPQLKCEACWQLTSNYCTMGERNICQSQDKITAVIDCHIMELDHQQMAGASF